jgi:hypothetical protein
VFNYFPGNYTWSSAVTLSIMAGAEQAEYAKENLRRGYRRSASARYLISAPGGKRRMA